jgi:hypothetical protein
MRSPTDFRASIGETREQARASTGATGRRTEDRRSAFDNHYRPALYLVDAGGIVRDHHSGEGRVFTFG